MSGNLTPADAKAILKQENDQLQFKATFMKIAEREKKEAIAQFDHLVSLINGIKMPAPEAELLQLCESQKSETVLQCL